MRDGLNELFRRTDDGEVPPRAASEGTVVKGRPYVTSIKVVGVGGGGMNAVNRMVDSGIRGVEFIAVNTDTQALANCEADVKIHIGQEITHGLGGGADPEVGRLSMEASRDELKVALRGADMVFITAGEGGGTGTGAAPVISAVARELDALALAIVTKPFAFEGQTRQRQAVEGIERLREVADTVIVIPNDRLLDVVDRTTSVVDAFRTVDDILRQGVQGITDLIIVPGLINLDFADVRTIVKDAGSALMGIGVRGGDNRAFEAATAAIHSPLLETSIKGARGILMNITGGPDVSLFEVNEAANIIAEAAHEDANIIFGAVVDERLEGQISITVVATGFQTLAGASAEGRRAVGPETTRHESGLGTPPAFDDGDLEIPSFLHSSEE